MQRTAAPPSRSGRAGARAAGVEHPGRGGRAAARRRRAVGRALADGRAPCRSPRSTPTRGRPCPPASAELDRVLGGGLVPGSVTLARRRARHRQVHAAAPGRWPALAEPGAACLYVIGRGVGAAGAAAGRAARRPAARTCGSWPRPSLPHVLGHVDEVAPDVVVVDSIQTVFDPELASAPGLGRRRCASAPHRLVRGGQGAAASPSCSSATSPRTARWPGRGCSSTSSTPCSSFEGDRHHALRLLRAGQAPLRLHRRARPVRDDRRRPRRRARPSGAVPRRPPPGRGRLGRGARARRAPAAARRGAGAGRRRRNAAHAAALGPGRRHRPAVAAARGARASGPASASADDDVYALAVGGVQVDEPGADLALALALVSRSQRRARARRPGGVRRGRPRRRAAPGRARPRAAWPRRPASASAGHRARAGRRPIRAAPAMRGRCGRRRLRRGRRRCGRSSVADARR